MGAYPFQRSHVIIIKNHGGVVEEIPGLLRVYKDGHVERIPVMQEVPPSTESDVASVDVSITSTVSARLFLPKRHRHVPYSCRRHPVILYFHGGGFCVGSAAWRCYHDFISCLSVVTSAVVVSINYRLAPEHRLPAAYLDGAAALKWLTADSGESDLIRWRCRCDFSRLFVAGDSAGAAIAYHTAISSTNSNISGLILIQPFFGGEARTRSERSPPEPTLPSALTLAVSDSYWRLALPEGADRDHRWCNPLSDDAAVDLSTAAKRLPSRVLVCEADLDILRDRNLELFRELMRLKKKRVVEHLMSEGVGHAFQVLHNSSSIAHARTVEMMTRIKAFIKANK